MNLETQPRIAPHTLSTIRKAWNDSICFVARKKIAEKVNMKMLSREMGITTLKMVYRTLNI